MMLVMTLHNVLQGIIKISFKREFNVVLLQIYRSIYVPVIILI